jgi:hypothetical protein
MNWFIDTHILTQTGAFEKRERAENGKMGKIP